MKPTRLATTAAAGLVVLAGLSGCSDNNDDHAAPATSTTMTTAAPTTTHADPTGTSIAPPPSPSPTPSPSPEPPPVTTTSDVAPTPSPLPVDVDCGPVTDAGGHSRTVIAVGNAAGRPGCTVAINVATSYVTTISPSDSVVVDGWQCNAQPDAATPSVCTKDGLVIALRAD
ncbi:hypothetical protein ACFWM1_07335 [Nocardia sp. NPDC058379]|uniref:hypothetical protein n=1 Tax=unclassified Nocardia TaxID=2637762 RepID=UPI0036494D69